MANWVIGDLHGCADEFSALLQDIGFDQSHDSLWLTGDIINRGPHCLEVLRQVHSLHQNLGSRFQIVLGNHDLHLLACWTGLRRSKGMDTIDSILAAEDVDRLCHWLRAWPFIHISDNHLLVHAGMNPSLSPTENIALAKELHTALSGPHYAAALESIYAHRTLTHLGLKTEERLGFAAAVFTRMRCINPDGSLNTAEKGSLDSIPPGIQPWFALLDARFDGLQIHTGHWAALGYGQFGPVVALDGGCVWGGDLVAVRRDLPHQPKCIRRGNATS